MHTHRFIIRNIKYAGLTERIFHRQIGKGGKEVYNSTGQQAFI